MSVIHNQDNLIQEVNQQKKIVSSQCVQWLRNIMEPHLDTFDFLSPVTEELLKMNHDFVQFAAPNIIPKISFPTPPTITGPAVNNVAHEDKPLSLVKKLMKNLLHNPAKHSLSTIKNSYKLIIETSKIIQCLADDLAGVQFTIDLQTGRIASKPAHRRNTDNIADDMKECSLKIEQTYRKVLVSLENLVGPVLNTDYLVTAISNKIRQIEEALFNRDYYMASCSHDAIIWTYSLKRVAEFFDLKETFERWLQVYVTWLDVDTLDENSPMFKFNEIDHVFSVKCHFWPNIAAGWLRRNSKSGFPTEELKTSIMLGGVFIVPKSYPGGNEDLDWRFSFSTAELELTKHWTDEQNLAYLIFKSIYYDQLYIPHENSVHNSISSYCLKTIMMWACEDEDEEFWTESNMMSCVSFLLYQLKMALQKSCLQHYFIDNLNLLQDVEPLFMDNIIQKVTSILQNPNRYPKGIDKILTATRRSDIEKKRSLMLQCFIVLQDWITRDPHISVHMKLILKPILDQPLNNSLLAHILTENYEHNSLPAFDVSSRGITDFINQIIFTPEVDSCEDVLIFLGECLTRLNWTRALGNVTSSFSNSNDNNTNKSCLIDIENMLRAGNLPLLIDHLLNNQSHIVTFAMYKHINYARVVLEMFCCSKVLTYTRTPPPQNYNPDYLKKSGKILTYMRIPVNEQCDGDDIVEAERISLVRDKLQTAVDKWNDRVKDLGKTAEVDSIDIVDILESDIIEDILESVLSLHNPGNFRDILEHFEQAANTPANMDPLGLFVLFSQIKMNNETVLLERLNSCCEIAENQPEQPALHRMTKGIQDDNVLLERLNRCAEGLESCSEIAEQLESCCEIAESQPEQPALHRLTKRTEDNYEELWNPKSVSLETLDSCKTNESLYRRTYTCRII